MNDPIVEEVRRGRMEHAAQFGFDLEAILAEFKRIDAESPRKHVQFGPRVYKRTSNEEIQPEPLVTNILDK